jgi:DNA-binding transcriptional LysR family regulator
VTLPARQLQSRRVMAFSFRQIQYFVAVAENGAVSRAAHALSISQSTVTESLRDLESDLGFPLFERQSNGVELTLKGHHFLRHAHKILAEIAHARHALRDSVLPVDQRLALGVTPLVASYVLSDLLARFRRAFPAVTVDIVEDGRDYLEHLLVGGELDVAVVVAGAETNALALQSETVEASPYRVWLPIGHPRADYGSIAVADLAEDPFVLLVLDETAEAAEEAWRRAGVRPRVAIRTRSVEAARSLVATGAGVAILPDLIYRPWSLEGDRIEARDLAQDLPPVKVAVVWRRGSPLPPAATQFIAVARTYRSPRR